MPITTPQGTLDFKKVDRVTFVGASSNTVIDTTTGSVGIGVVGDALSSNLHVVGDTRMEGNINMLHTSNTASIKLNSNVVTEFPRSKKLIKYPRVALTANSSGGYVASANAEESDGRAVWKLFDNTGNATAWRSEGNGDYNASGAYTGSANLGSDSGGTAFADADKGDWVKIQLPHKIKLDHFTLQVRNSPTFPGGSSISYGRSEFIKNGKVWGSNDGTSWSVVHTISGTSASSDTAINSYTVTSSIYYRYFGLVITDTNATVTGLGTSLSEIELYGVPEYDPEADGVDVTVKSLPNVPNTDWLEVYYDAKDLADEVVTTVDDLTPGGTNDGTPYGGVTVSDGAFVLDGTNDYITTPALGFSGDQPYSISIWFRSDRPQTDMTTENGIYGFGYGNNLTAGLSWWSPVTNGSSSLRHWHSGSAGKNFPNTTFLENKWNHVLIVYPGGGAFNIRAWLNGVERMGVNGTGNSGANNDFSWSTGDSVIIGDWYNSSGPRLQSPWDGSIANFRLFNRAISSDEIYQLYAYQKEYFGHGDLGMTLKAGRLGIGTSEPKAALDVSGRIMREYNTGEVIEELHAVCASTSLRGKAVIQNVTSSQNLGTGLALATGSSVEGYIIPKGTKNIVYEYTFHTRFSDTHGISHWRLYYGINGGDLVEVTNARMDLGGNNYEDKTTARWVFEVDAGSEDVSIGRLTAKAGDSIDFKWYAREYSSGNELTLHLTQYWDGTFSDMFSQPLIMIKAIA